jgi:hypothetical protein
MGVTELFSTSFLICLAICLILVCCLFMYFNQKINEQNHKITSMFDLVSTMAEEVNSVKQYTQLVMNKVGLPLNAPVVMNNNENLHSILYNGGSNTKENNLISISEDDEESDDDDEEEDTDDDEEDTDSDEEDTDNEEESDEEEDNEDNVNEEDKNKKDDSDNESYSGLNFEKVANGETNNEVEELDINDIKNLKTININFNTNDTETEQENEFDIESEDLTDINVKNVEVLDYKKLSLNKLRSIVTEKGMVTDASKLKKNDLLKLLEVE